MKTRTKRIQVTLALLALFTLNLQPSTARAQDTAFTYQGRVTDNGTNFTGAGQFKFALVTSTNTSSPASVTAVMGGASPNEFVNGYAIVSGGSGYATAPAVTVSAPGGSGATATATATISGGAVTAINIISPGSGYSSTPTVTIAPPPPNVTYTTYWSNDGTSAAGSEPASAVGVGVNNGLFTVVLGDTTLAGMTAIPASVFTTQPGLQLQMWFNDGVNGFAMLNPLQNLTPAPYAVQALNASSASNLLGALPAVQLSGTLPLAQLPAAVVTNNETSVTVDNLTLNGALNLPAVPVAIFAGGNLLLRTDDSGNFLVGPNAGNLTMTGYGNTANGVSALHSITFGSENTANGSYALYYNIDGTYNTANGAYALEYNTTGNENTAVGADALYENRDGFYNTAIGSYALYFNTTGNGNTAIGVGALEGSVSGSGNIALGDYAGGSFNGSESNNIDIGNGGVTGENNIIRIGTPGIQTSTFIAGVLNGNGGGLTNLNASQLTGIGNNNFFAGSAGKTANSGSDNTAMGAQALTNNTSGTGNTAFGFGALQNATGNFNFGYGYLAGSGLTTGANNVDIAAAGLSGDNAVIRIGTPGIQTATYIAGVSGATAASGVAVYVNSSGQLGTLTSSRRYKQDIQGMDQASDVLYALKPVTFKYKPGIDPQGIPQFGLVAEDVEKVAPDLVAHDDQGKIYTVRYQAVDAMLLNEFLKEHRTVEEQSGEIQNLKQQNDSLEKRLNELEKAVASVAEKSGAAFALNSKATGNK